MTGEIAKVSVSGVRAKAYGRRSITAGTIGATVTFTYDESWEGMMKTLVWKGSGRIVDDTTASGTVPAEVVTEAGTSLFVGVYGTRDGVATPTVWADLGVILEGVDPSGDESTDPSLPVWAQVLEHVDELEEVAEQAKVVVGDACETALEAKEKAERSETVSGQAEVKAEQALAAAQNAELVAEQANITANSASAAAEQAKDIARGRATGYVFDTVEDMDLWLSDEENTSKLALGDNLYIRDVNEPDYWWDGEQRQVLETQKVDLSEYVKKTQYQTQGKPGLCQIPNWATGKNGLIQTNQKTVPGGFHICCATEADINSRESKYKPIVPANLDYAVKSAATKLVKNYSTPELDTSEVEGDFLGQILVNSYWDDDAASDYFAAYVYAGLSMVADGYHIWLQIGWRG